MVEAAAWSRIDVIPSVGRLTDLSVTVGTEAKPGAVEAVGYFVTTDGPVPDELGTDRVALAACGFAGRLGQSLVLPGGDGLVRVAVGVGEAGTVSANDLRDAAATCSRAVPHLRRLALRLPDFAGVPVAAASGAAVEGAVLGRYHFHIRAHDDTVELSELALVVNPDQVADADTGARRGRVVTHATSLGRDLANCPAGYLTATRMGEVAREVGCGPAWRSRSSTRRPWSSWAAAACSG